MNKTEWRRKAAEKQLELARKKLREGWDDIDRLEYMIWSIAPGSVKWRSGMISALRHAIRLMKEEKEKTDDSDL